MLWAIASSVFVIYLYRKLNAKGAPAAEGDDSIDAELDALNARITALETAIVGTSAGEAKPMIKP